MAETTLLSFQRGKYKVELRMDNDEIDALLADAFNDAERLSFEQPKSRGQHPYQKRIVGGQRISVRTTDQTITRLT